MLIQNISNTGQASQLERIATSRLAGSGGSVAVANPASQPASAQVESDPSPEQLKGAVETINRSMRQSNQSLEFSVTPDSATPVVKLVDTSTGEVIRQIPSKETLAIAQAIDQFQDRHQQGLLLKQKA